MRVGGIVVRGAAWALSALVLVATLASPGSPLTVLRASEAQTLLLSGDIAGLAPGAPGALVITVRNPSAEPALVSALDARITASPAGCPRGALEIGTWRGRLVVPAQGSARATLSVVLVSTERACAGASWSLEYSSR